MPQSDFWPFPKNKDVEGIIGGPSVLQKQLGDMEGEVKEIQMELAAIRRNRLDLYNKKHLKGDNEAVTKDNVIEFDVLQKCNNYNDISKLREELIRAKNAADEERFQRQRYEDKLKDLELKLNNICSTGTLTDAKEPRRLIEEDNAAMKIQIRDLKEELEESNITLAEKCEQLQEYRIKYLQAEQQAEELRRQVEAIEFDNKQVSDQIQLEIQKMKMQFQDKLQELSPLPDLLKGAQLQLQEAKQMQRLAEDSSQQLSTELHRVKEKLVIAVNNLNVEKAEVAKLLEENKALRETIDEKQREIQELEVEIEKHKCTILRIEEKLSQNDMRFKEKAIECAQLLKDLDELRVESNRAIARTKERSDSMRRYLQSQISELERQLVQSRAHCRACQKERDEIRQRMQIQLSNLQENFELVEIRLRGLQNQITSLKNSNIVILADDCDDNSDFNKIV